MRTIAMLVVLGTGCATSAPAGPVTHDPGEVELGSIASSVPDVRCDGTPSAGKARGFRHFTSKLIAALGDPKHRGFDLVASAEAETQTLEGWISYTIIDKALEDEDVDVFACRAGAWQRIGGARTDDEGHFTRSLDDDARLPIGMRDLFVSVVGDRTGVGFLGYVAPSGTRLAASDVDGTLTSSENAFFETVVLGLEPDARAGAPAAFDALVAKAYQPVYVTARGNQYTTDTRRWLEHKGFARGPVRLSPSFVTLPGGDTIDYKTATLGAIVDAGLDLAVGIGNRATDVTAYGNVGLAGDRIFVELPDYQSELQPLIDAGAATGFDRYAALPVADLP